MPNVPTRMTKQLTRALKPLRSIIGLLRVSFLHAGRSVAACLRADREAAGVHFRNLLLTLLDDASRALVALQRIMPGRRQVARRVDRILVVKLDRIGDMVTTLPAFDALLEKYPGAKIDVVGHPLPLQLLVGDQRINELIPYRSWLYHPVPMRPPGWPTVRLIARLLARRYPLVVCLRGSFSFLPLAFTSRFTATNFVEGEPVIRRYLRAIEVVTGPVSETFPRLSVNDGRRCEARGTLSAGGSGPRVTIHATASASAKMWPAERFAEVADQLRERHGAMVFFLGAASDGPALRKIADVARHAHTYLSTIELPQSVALIAESDVFIGNDSGLAHVAAAVETPAVVIWGAPNLNMARPKTRDNRCIVLYHELACRRTCREFRCSSPNQLECLTRTEVDDVVRAVDVLLAAPTAQTGVRSCVRSI